MSFFIVLISGILMGLSAAPVSAFLLAWVALVPLWLLITVKPISLKKTVLLSLCWGCGYYGLSLFWIWGIHPMTWMGVPWIPSFLIALFCWIFITLWGSGIAVFWSIGVYFLYRFTSKVKGFKAELISSWLRVFISVALWNSLEWLWSQGDLWWSSLSYTQSPKNLWILHLGQLSGSFTITIVIVLINGLIAEALLSYLRKRKTLSFILVSLGLLLISLFSGLGWYLSQIPLAQNNQQAIKIGIIQGNIPNKIKLYPEGFRRAIEGYTSGYKTLAQQGVDLVITPETALPFYFTEIVQHGSFYPTILSENVPVLLGAFYQKGDRYTNSLLMINRDGKLIDRFDKIILVPLGEYIPFESILGKFIDRLSPLKAHLAKGEPQQILETPFGEVIVGICYESAYSKHFRDQAKRGGEWIVTASNDSHYSPAMLSQHHALDIMRAIETDRWLARATNTGYSAIVNPHGETMWRSQINTYEIYSDTIYRRTTETLYVKWGDWLTVCFLIVGIMSLIVYCI